MHHLLPPLGELIEARGAEHTRIAQMLGLPGEATRDDFTQLFVVQLFPYASLYLSPRGVPDARVRADIAQFFQQLGAPAPEEPDHISALLKWYGLLQSSAFLSTNAEPLRHAFYWSTVASWLPGYLLRARELGSEPYKAWADVTLDVLEAEAARVGPPALLPHYLATSPPLPPVSEANDFVHALFAPVVSGLIICRADLGRCAQATGLKVRVADRRQTLKLFLAENLSGVCAWLRAEADRQAEILSELPHVFAPVRDVWVERARQSALMVAEFEQLYTQQQPFST